MSDLPTKKSGSIDFSAGLAGVKVDVQEQVNKHFSIGGGVEVGSDGNKKVEVDGKITW
jgi:hypothetical protein